ncbi:MAG: 23S rRNA (guanosine(2251)-2'-O)-methyltransferase RlmB, partial [Tenericutes bacterium]|nr:23S rRNA (guanosine(2251)-2'-O)-methyltransferase RlmB [Mycoplasmatota bacterium]
EGKGISKIVKDNVDYNIKIDMIGKINSLNASVSAGILIFEILRKKL